MKWQQLISNKRLGQEIRHSERHDDRSEFKRDYDRLIFSAPFRRLQNKTQVFPLPGSIFVHNRLTHSLEVASVGKSLGDDVAHELKKRHPELAGTLFEEIGSIVSAACLAHDMGNPPFGHSGESAIRAFFAEGKGRPLKEHVNGFFWSDICRFDGNANAFRLLSHKFKGRRNGGFAMTYAMLASIVKYPFPSYHAAKCKFGFFTSEYNDYLKIADELGIPQLSMENGHERWARHPLVYLVEAADDICYEVMDIEDAHKLKLLSFEETQTLLLKFIDEMGQNRILERIKEEQIDDKNEQINYIRACVIGVLEHECVKVFVEHEDEILAGTFEGSLIDHIGEPARSAYEACKKLSKVRIYGSKIVLDVELSGYKIMETLMETFIEAVLHPDKFYSRQLLNRVSSQYEIDAPDLETRIMAIIDFITGMTDVYALDLYQKIRGISLPVV